VKSGTFENTFAPAVAHKRLAVREIMAGMSIGAIQPDSLPEDVLEALGAEIKRREKRQMTATMFLTLVLGTVGEVKCQLRLQKYVFLADSQFSRSRKGGKTADLVYGWKPCRDGPFSEHLEACVKDLVRAKTVETFGIHENGKDPGVGYRLTVKGSAEYRKMVRNLEGESKAIRALLEKFQRDSTERQLTDFVRELYPEYTTKSRMRDRFPGKDRGL